MMIPTTVYIEPKQESKIKAALRKRKGCRIKMQNLHGYNSAGLLKGEMLLNSSQLKKYQKAAPGKSIALPFQHKHLLHNMNHKGGILPLLAALLAPILGGVAGGLIEKEIAGSGLSRFSGKPWWHGSGVAGGLIEKETAGSGIHPPKLILCKRKASRLPVAFQIDPATHDGNGLYLSPWKQNFNLGTGLYLSPYPHKTGSGLKKLEHGMFAHCRQFSNSQRKSLRSLLDVL